MCEETDNSGEKKKSFFRKPDGVLLCATSVVLIYAVWCAVALTLAVLGQLWSNQSLKCGLDAEEIQNFQKPYLALLPFTKTNELLTNVQISDDDILNKVNCWQIEFKCCGLKGFQDWNISFPSSCFYNEEHTNSWVESSWVPRRNIHEKACLPTVISLVEKRGSTFWIIMTVWLTVHTAPFAIGFLAMVVGCSATCLLICDPSHMLNVLQWTICGREKMVPVVFIRKNNNRTEEENMEAKEDIRKDCVVLDTEDLDDNPLRMIPVSLLRRLQEELDPPPVQHWVQNSHKCLVSSSNAIREFYTVLVEEGSPLLPCDAVLVDADKPTRVCGWSEGHKEFNVEDIVWPQDRLNRNPQC
ncbi:uncharacterized protein LOC103358114 isoform X2 [Stegastes partitus]|uniref:Uncharacterized protein LOC103358114 isoform X2 n=1 Tax=Stegastes partitus TaxID=144197 RepID=A0A9Y4JWW1_9TELE|nr:PREDICTED: uncharacterized protein LOC103358114 isoform X2 [Stegastes partitus]